MKVIIMICYFIVLFASMGFILNSFLAAKVDIIISYISTLIIGIAISILIIPILEYCKKKAKH